MRKFLQEYREFLTKGDIIMIAVGLTMALYFTAIVNAFIEGVIMPIIAAIFGETDFTAIGFDIGDARISIGLVIDALIKFVIVALLLFLVLKAYTRMRGETTRSANTEISLLTEIRDELRTGRGGPEI